MDFKGKRKSDATIKTEIPFLMSQTNRSILKLLEWQH